MRQLLASLERDLGLEALPRVELELIYAIDLLTGTSDNILTSAEIRQHELIKDIPTATFNRALKALIERGYIEYAPQSRAKHYQKGQHWPEAQMPKVRSQ